MTVKEARVWGTRSEDIVKYGKRYSLYSKSIYVLDILVTIFVLHLMFVNGTYFGDYVRYMLLSFIVCALALNLPLNEDKYLTYKFIRKFGKYEVSAKDYIVDSSILYACLHKTYKSKLKKDDSVENYLSLVNTSCQRNKTFSKNFMVSLDDLTSKAKSDSCVSVEVLYILVSKKKYFIGYSIKEVE